MALEQHINELLNEMKKLDMQPEEDLREYARLLSEMDRHKKLLDTRRAEVQDFDKVFGLLSRPDIYQLESNHVAALEQAVADEKYHMESVQATIDKRKEYYSALSAKESERLWQSSDEASHIAAIYCAFGSSKRSVAERVKFFVDAKSDMSESVAKYLAVRALVASEQEKVSESERKKLDGILKQLLQKREAASDDTIWREVEEVLKIRNTARLRDECEKLHEEYKVQETDYDRFRKGFKETRDRLNKQMKTIYDGVTIGKNVSDVSLEAEKTYRSSKREMQNAIAEREKQQDKIEQGVARLEKVQKKLQAAEESGLSLQECETLQEELKALEKQLEDFMTISNLEKKQTDWMAAFNKMVSDIHAASDRDASAAREKEQARARKKVEKREQKQQNRRRTRFRRIACVLLLIFVIPDVAVHSWAHFTQPMWEIDEENVLRVNGADVQFLTVNRDISLIYPASLNLVADASNYLEEVITFHNSLKIAKLLEETGGVLELPEDVDGVKPASVYLLAEEDMEIKTIQLPASVKEVKKIYAPTLTNLNLDKVENINYSAFRGYSSIQSCCSPIAQVNLSSLKVLGESAFYGNPNIQVIIATQLEEVPSRAFEYCTALQAAELPAVKAVGEYAFRDCVSLTSVNVFSAESIGQGAFSGCVNLKDIKMFAVKSIGADAFGAGSTTAGNRYVYPAVEEVYLPAIESISAMAFQRVYTLRKVYLGGNLEFVVGNSFPTENQQYEFILDSNASYSQKVMDVLKGYGVPISYVDFNTLSF